MKYVTLYCNEVHTKADLYDVIKPLLELPGWCGNNLDALHDALSEAGCTLFLKNSAALGELPDGYGRKLLEMLTNSADEYRNFKLIIE